MYAGIDVTATALFTGTAGAQLAGRAGLINCDPLPATARTSTTRAGNSATGDGRSSSDDHGRSGGGEGSAGGESNTRRGRNGSSADGADSRRSGGGNGSGTVLIRPFRETVAAMENALDLQRHRPGSLVRLAPYLHQRTAGRIGSLSRLLRRAAITAILDQSEKITRPALDAIALDHLAEEHYRPRVPARRTQRANTPARRST